MSGVSQRAQKALGLPDGFKAVSVFPFAGIDQAASRTGMDDKRFYWLENFVRIGAGKLRTVYDVGAALYTSAGAAIVGFYWFNIGPANYCAVFLADGTAVQVAYPSGAVTRISAVANTFYQASSGQLPACCPSGGQYLLISNNNTENDYWIWDGAILYGSGSIGPITANAITNGGSGYTSVPSYTVFGGSGSGVVLTPIVAVGSIVGLQVTNPGTGYLPGQVVQIAFGGGGTATSAILQAVLATNTVAYVTLVAGGLGYTPGTYALSFSGGGGTGAAGYFVVAATGVVQSAVLTASGSGYTSNPTVGFSGAGGSGAAAVAALTGGSVASVTVVNGGNLFTGTPTLTIIGGGGTGATAIANMSAGSIASVTITNGGSGYSSAPAVEVQSGVNNAASAILTLMPFGISGTTIEQYQSRVWIAYPNKSGNEPTGGIFNVSAPNSTTDYATSDGGDIFTNTDRFLRANYTFLRQTSNFLYAIGDSSVSVISNVQTGGNPTSTTFSYQNTDPQTGTIWRDTAQDYANTILFANAFGVYGIYGGSVRKVSKDIDDLFTNAVLPPTAGAVTPIAAVVNIYSQKLYVLLMTVMDPTTLTTRTVMVAWDQQEWTILSQSITLMAIGTQEIASNIQAWGTDGVSLYPLFNTPSAALSKKLSTKQYGGTQPFLTKMSHSIYLEAEDKSVNQVGISFPTASIDGVGLAVPAVNSVTAATLSCPSTSVPFAQPMQFVAPAGIGSVYARATPDVPGLGIGATLVSQSPDFVLKNLVLGLIDYAAVA